MNNAKTVTAGVSQRANKSQTAFKPVLGDPLSIQWPEIPPNVQNSFQTEIVDLLSCLKDYHIQQNRKGKNAAPARKKAAKREKEKEEQLELSGKKRKMADDAQVTASSKRRKSETGASREVPDPSDSNEPGDKNVAPLEAPEILKNVKCGLNETGKALEQHISNLRDSLTIGLALTDDVITPRIVLACRWDVNPADLFSHIPHLVASANTLGVIYNAKFASAPSIPDIKLVNLPQGSEKGLSEAVGIHRLSIVILNSRTVLGPRLIDLLDKVPRLKTPWLVPTTNPTSLTPTLQPTHIKHLKTTAPTDLRASKKERSQARKEAKKRRRKARLAHSQAKPTIDVAADLQHSA